MADKFYRAEIVINVDENQAETTVNKFQKNFERRTAVMNRIRINPVASIQDRISSPAKRIEASLKHLGGVRTVTIRAVDQVSKVVKRIASTLTSPLALMGGGAGATAAVVFPLRVSGEMYRARQSIEFYSGSLDEGKKNFEDFVNFALKSPIYELPFVAQTAGQLLATGQTADFAKRSLQAFGNAAMYTGAGMSQLELAFYGFKQISAVGTLQMEELRQVTENLNVPLAWVAEEMGLTGDELRNVGNAAIPANKAMEAIVRTFEKRFPMKSFNDDLLALTANVKESGRVIVWQFGDGMAKPVTRILQDLTGILDPTSDKFANFKNQVSDAGAQVGEFFERGYNRFKDLFGDEKFKGMSIGDKLITVIDRGLDGMIGYLDGPGGAKIESVFTKLGEIAGRAWMATLKGTFTATVKEAGKGNLFGALAFGGMFSLLGGGLLLKGGLEAGKAATRGGRWIGENIIKNPAAKTAPILSPGVTAAGEAIPILSSTGKITNIPIGAAAEGTGLAGVAGRAAGVGSKALSMAGGALSKVGRFVGRAAWPVAIGAGVLEIASERTPAEKIAKTAEVGGGLAGALAGGKLGAAIGTAIAPGIGTAIGGILGGLGGYIGGRKIGGSLVNVKAAEAGEVTASPAVKADMDNLRAMESFQATTQATTQAMAPMELVMQENVAIMQSFNVNLQNQATEIIARMGTWLERTWTITGISTAFAANLQDVADNVIANGRELVNALAGAASRAASFVMPTFSATTAITGVEPHAQGGILTSPHLGLVAEAGPEAVIPLSKRMRSRGLALWQQAGQHLDVGSQLSRIAEPVDNVISNGWSLVGALSNAASRARSFVLPSFGSTPAVPHAAGGIFSSPHLGLVAEAGPEAIIPLSGRMRSRGLELLQQVGGYFGGSSPAPAFAGVGLGLSQYLDGSYGYSNNQVNTYNQPVTASSGDITVSVPGVKVNIHIPTRDIDEDALARTIGYQIIKPIINALENKV